MIQNPKTLNWANPATALNLAGQSVAWAAATDQAAVSLVFDAAAPVQVPVAAGSTSLDLTKVASYMTLANGQHTVTVSEVTDEGIVGGASAPVTFLVGTVPAQPTAVTLS